MPPPRTIHLRLDLPDEASLVELRRALLRARASELGEARRRALRSSTGYGDATTRDVLEDEGRRAQLRHDLLDRLLDALGRATDDPG